jgi:hypothetical protein
MSVELELKTAVCSEYEVLLDGSQRALKTWNEERAAICESGAKGRATDMDLLRSQAKYARAYARLQRHVRECSRCQVVASMAKRLESGAGAETEVHCYD